QGFDLPRRRGPTAQSNEQAVERGGLRREIVRLPRRGTRSGDIHPEIGCQTWTRTKTNGLTDRRATLTPPGNGAAGRTSTCIVPLRRRMPHVFGHGSNLKLVSAAGFAPAVTRSQAGHVAATPRAVRPGVLGAHRGLVFMGMRDPHTLNLSPAARFTKLALSMGLAPTLFPQTTGCFSIQLRERNGGKCW